MLPKLLRFAAGLALGFALWWWTLPVYLDVLAHEAAIIRIDRRYADIEMITRGNALFVRSATGVFPPITLPGDQLTYNVILLVALFALEPLSMRTLRRFLIALAIVLAFHPLGLFISAESTYAARVPPWSQMHYTRTGANAWVALETFWRLVGMFGVVFAVWWTLTSTVRRS